MMPLPQSTSSYYSYTNNNNYTACQMSYSGASGGGYPMSSLSPVTGDILILTKQRVCKCQKL